MSFIDSIAKRFGYQREGVRQKREFAAAAIDRLTADWNAFGTSADAEAAAGVRTLRARSRSLERDNEYAQKYLVLLDNNVLGSAGVGLQMKVRDLSGTLDEVAGNAIKEAWTRWCKVGNCDVTRQLSFRAIESLVIHGVPVNGGILVRFVRGFENEFRFALQVLEIDQLDFDYNAELGERGNIRFGVQMDKWGAVVGYHVLTRHPGDISGTSSQRIFVTAKEMLHIFWRVRPGQTIGYPWMSSVLKALWDLGKLQEAHLVACREAACKGIAIKTMPDPNGGFRPANNENELIETAPGMVMRLNQFEEIQQLDPAFPVQGMPEAIKSRLRGIATGLGVSYHALGADLSDANYSSLRAGRIEEVEEWKNIQAWLVESLHSPVFSAWLEMALTIGAIRVGNSALPLAKFDKFNAPQWMPRRWPWVDPLKDLQASVLAVEKGFATRTQIISENGGDIANVFEELGNEEKLEEKYGLDFSGASESANEATAMPKGSNGQPRVDNP